MKKSIKYRISIITSWVGYAAVQSQKAFSAYLQVNKYCLSLLQEKIRVKGKVI